MLACLDDLLLNDRGFAFDPAGGETYQLSPTGLRVVRLLQQGLGEDAVVERLVNEYEVEEQTVRRDVEVFLRNLEVLGWK